MIPGVETFHPRSSWVDPRYPVIGPPSPTADIDTAVIHYTAADDLIDGDPGEHAEDLPAYFRAMNRSYWTNRVPGYALGYRWGVDWLGGVWQIRGWAFQSAANSGHNGHTEPILVLVDGNDMATDEAVHSIRCIIAESQRRSGRTFAIKGHGQLREETGVGTATSCPGVGLRAQIAAGVFSPAVVRPPVSPTPGDVDMLAIDHKPNTPEWTALTWTGSHLAHVTDGHADAVVRRAGVQRLTVNDVELDGIIRSSTTTTACPSAWVNTPRGAAWQARRA